MRRGFRPIYLHRHIASEHPFLTDKLPAYYKLIYSLKSRMPWWDKNTFNESPTISFPLLWLVPWGAFGVKDYFDQVWLLQILILLNENNRQNWSEQLPCSKEWKWTDKHQSEPMTCVCTPRISCNEKNWLHGPEDRSQFHVLYCSKHINSVKKEQSTMSAQGSHHWDWSIDQKPITASTRPGTAS